MEKNLGGDPEIFQSRFELYAKMGKPELAVAQIDALIQKYPGQNPTSRPKRHILLIKIKRQGIGTVQRSAGA